MIRSTIAVACVSALTTLSAQAQISPTKLPPPKGIQIPTRTIPKIPNAALPQLTFNCPANQLNFVPESPLSGGWSIPSGGVRSAPVQPRVDPNHLVCDYGIAEVFHPIPQSHPECSASNTRDGASFLCSGAETVRNDGAAFVRQTQMVDFETDAVGGRMPGADIWVNARSRDQYYGLVFEAVNGAKIEGKGDQPLTKASCEHLRRADQPGDQLGDERAPAVPLRVNDERNRYRYYCVLTAEGNIGQMLFSEFRDANADVKEVLLNWKVWD